MSDLHESREERRPILTYAAYHNFVSIIFSVALTAWATTLFGLNPVAGTGGGAAWWDRPILNLAGGVLYGATLICLYWIYSDRIATYYRPRNLFMMVVDFISLAFLTAAALGWTREEYFNSVAIFTVLCLTVRFGIAYRRETELRGRGLLPPRETVMRDVCWVYLGYLGLVTVLFAGAVILGGGIDPAHVQKAMYASVLGGMAAGIATTLGHSLRRSPERYEGPSNEPITNEEHLPILTPAYGAAAQDRLPALANAVFQGEAWFRRIVAEHAGPQYRFHQSLVHPYRDVETQAFIMAHPGRDDEEMALRAMWVYLAHWFDDLFDGPAAPAMATWRFEPDFDVASALRMLDGALERVWRAAVDRTARLKGWDSRRWFLETGMRRLMMGGPMFAASCADEHKRLMAAHKEMIAGRVKDSADVRALVENASPRYLAYTSKVVVEIWDSFADDARYEASVLMNMFYAPGLLYHDVDAECGHLEMRRDESLLTEKVVRDHIGKVLACLKDLPRETRRSALRPVRMFVGAFGRILQKRGLLEDYRGFLDDDRVTEVIVRD